MCTLVLVERESNTSPPKLLYLQYFWSVAKSAIDMISNIMRSRKYIWPIYHDYYMYHANQRNPFTGKKNLRAIQWVLIRGNLFSEGNLSILTKKLLLLGGKLLKAIQMIVLFPIENKHNKNILFYKINTIQLSFIHFL